jgi:hypothetical protein
LLPLGGAKELGVCITPTPGVMNPLPTKGDANSSTLLAREVRAGVAAALLRPPPMPIRPPPARNLICATCLRFSKQSLHTLCGVLDAKCARLMV